MKNNLPIVVIGQNYCTSLGVIKALGEAGYRVELGKRINRQPRFYTPEMKSKYVDKAAYLHTATDDEMIKSVLKNFADSNKGRKILIPTDDFCVALFDRHFDELSQYFILPNVNKRQGAVVELMNKDCQNALARKCGINVAESVTISVTSEEKAVIPHNTPFPCFIKPITSVGNPKSYSRKCENRETLADIIFQIAQEHECTLLAEQYIEIEKEYTIPGIAIGGEVIIPAILEKFRTGEGAHKGVTIAGRVHNSGKLGDFVGKLREFVSQSCFQGIFDIELLQSKDELYFNEINLRNGAAGYSLTKSGINLPAMYVYYLEESIIPQISYDFEAGRTFVNEKAALENYLDGYSTFGKMLKNIYTANIKFVLGFNDNRACRRFWLLALYLISKKYLRTLFS